MRWQRNWRRPPDLLLSGHVISLALPIPILIDAKLWWISSWGIFLKGTGGAQRPAFVSLYWQFLLKLIKAEISFMRLKCTGHVYVSKTPTPSHNNTWEWAVTRFITIKFTDKESSLTRYHQGPSFEYYHGPSLYVFR